MLQALQGLADSESHRAQIGLLGSVYEPGGHSCSPSKLNQACALLEGSSPSVTSKNHLGKHTVALPLSGKISGKGMACTGDASKCSNDACSKPGVHLCSRCRGAKYCSAACQKVHWKQGGHKQECIPAGHPGVVTKTVAATAARAGARVGSCVGTCIICLDSDPSPIQSGCACRGDAGLAHVECRAEAAAHRLKNSKTPDGWWECATCGQDFTGAMQLGLAEAWWSRVQRLPEVDEQRLRAAANLARSLGEQSKLAEAEAMLRDLLPVQRRVFGP